MSSEVIQHPFTVAVIDDVKLVATKEQQDLLHSDVKRWIMELQNLIRDVDIQFSARKAQAASVRAETYDNGNEAAWFAYQVTDKDWRVKVNRYKASLEAKLRQVKSLRAQSLV